MNTIINSLVNGFLIIDMIFPDDWALSVSISCDLRFLSVVLVQLSSSQVAGRANASVDE